MLRREGLCPLVKHVEENTPAGNASAPSVIKNWEEEALIFAINVVQRSEDSACAHAVEVMSACGRKKASL
jgi:hypothetical protein